MNTDPMKLRVVRADPGQAPVDIEIPNNLQGLQDVVGGYLEPVHRVPLQVGRELVYYANEEGRSLGLLPNRTIGPLDVVGPNPGRRCLGQPGGQLDGRGGQDGGGAVEGYRAPLTELRQRVRRPWSGRALYEDATDGGA